jgi:hypothetical protein
VYNKNQKCLCIFWEIYSKNKTWKRKKRCQLNQNIQVSRLSSWWMKLFSSETTLLVLNNGVCSVLSVMCVWSLRITITPTGFSILESNKVVVTSFGIKSRLESTVVWPFKTGSKLFKSIFLIFTICYIILVRKKSEEMETQTTIIWWIKQMNMKSVKPKKWVENLAEGTLIVFFLFFLNLFLTFNGWFEVGDDLLVFRLIFRLFRLNFFLST